MADRLTDGPGPYGRPFRLWVAREQGYPLAMETLLLMEALCLAYNRTALWRASTLIVAHWRRGTVQVGSN